MAGPENQNKTAAHIQADADASSLRAAAGGGVEPFCRAGEINSNRPIFSIDKRTDSDTIC